MFFFCGFFFVCVCRLIPLHPPPPPRLGKQVAGWLGGRRGGGVWEALGCRGRMQSSSGSFLFVNQSSLGMCCYHFWIIHPDVKLLLGSSSLTVSSSSLSFMRQRVNIWSDWMSAAALSASLLHTSARDSAVRAPGLSSTYWLVLLRSLNPLLKKWSGSPVRRRWGAARCTALSQVTASGACACACVSIHASCLVLFARVTSLPSSSPSLGLINAHHDTLMKRQGWGG